MSKYNIVGCSSLEGFEKHKVKTGIRIRPDVIITFPASLICTGFPIQTSSCQAETFHRAHLFLPSPILTSCLSLAGFEQSWHLQQMEKLYLQNQHWKVTNMKKKEEKKRIKEMQLTNKYMIFFFFKEKTYQIWLCVQHHGDEKFREQHDRERQCREDWSQQWESQTGQKQQTFPWKKKKKTERKLFERQIFGLIQRKPQFS